MAAAIWDTNPMTCSGRKCLHSLKTSAIVSPAMYSIARKGTLSSVSPMSKRVTMLGWDNVPEILAS